MDEKNLCKTRAFHVNVINLIHIKKYQIKNINNTDILLQIYFFFHHANSTVERTDFHTTTQLFKVRTLFEGPSANFKSSSPHYTSSLTQLLVLYNQGSLFRVP